MNRIRTLVATMFASAKKIQDALNNANYRVKSGERWHTYDVSEWDSAYDFAQFQSFQIRKGKLPVYRAEANGVKGTDFWK